ncbi:putative acetyl-hydrolase LipR precursor [Marinobacter litoralis]|uniref:Putative acetyl-hydrolase LipR n=1 Tax=Marinobacter litoralis TaxID=187981 RepID=A0A3M2RG12_9GAMM|nr:alpha/beta hydrolase [Marinobacter litoralis]RMJ04099.1 putative acetyl-hydrolase LipR precursor [Marinobacter litoralis]
MFQPLLEAILRQTMCRLVRPLLSNGVSLELQRKLIRQAYRTSLPPRSVRFTSDTLGQVPVLRGLPNTRSTGTIVYLHGGGYILGSAATHKGIAGHLAKLTGCEVIIPDYRLAPEHPYPAAPDDAEAVFQAVIREGKPAERIAIAGDSAGGGLALVLAMRLREHGQPLPSSITCFSPWTDLTSQQLYSPECEPVLHASWVFKAAKMYAGEGALTDPMISPAFGDLKGLPPTLIQVGSQEILLNDATRLADAAKTAEVDVTLEIYNSLWHVFQTHCAQLQRASDALVTAAKHIRRHLAE